MNKRRVFLGVISLLAMFYAFAQQEEHQQGVKVDGVAAVVGDYLILESDIDKAYIELKTQNVDTKDITRCQLLGKLMEDKLYAHQATQDSIEVKDEEIRSAVNRQIQMLTEYMGGDIKKVVTFYRKDSEQALRDELFNLYKVNELSKRMKAKITEKVEVTPEEVRLFFERIPKEDLPTFPSEVEIAQIVKEPKAPEDEVKKVVDRLKEIKKEVLTNGASFATKAILYSQDRATGGNVLTFNRTSPFDKDFKDVAFSLQEGEISEPFQSAFGWHIIQLDKIRGKEVSVRHILLVPDIPKASLEETKKEIQRIRGLIEDKSVDFKEAARNFSDEKETRNDGGQLINPEDLSTRFELTRMEPVLYGHISKLKEGEMSQPIFEEDRTGKKKFKIYKLTKLYKEHKADFKNDYTKIQAMALKEKQLNAIEKWLSENIQKVHILVSDSYKNCKFTNDWVKK